MTRKRYEESTPGDVIQLTNGTAAFAAAIYPAQGGSDSRSERLTADLRIPV